MDSGLCWILWFSEVCEFTFQPRLSMMHPSIVCWMMFLQLSQPQSLPYSSDQCLKTDQFHKGARLAFICIGQALPCALCWLYWTTLSSLVHKVIH